MFERYQKRIIYTSDRCVNCDSCIANCPVPTANVAIRKKQNSQIVVDGKACIDCGHCVLTCPQHAREYADDTDTFFADLAAGKSVSIAVDPTFYYQYPKKSGAILGCLKRMGVRHIYDVGFGADIMVWRYLRYFSEISSNDEVHQHICVSQSCPAVMNYFIKYLPELIENLIPIPSPAVCLSIYVKKYLHNHDRLAVLSPCVTQKDLTNLPDEETGFQYSVTFLHLMQKIRSIDFDGESEESELKPWGNGPICALSGGLKEYLSEFLPASVCVLSMDNMYNVYNKFLRDDADIKKTNFPVVVDAMHCNHGCIYGPGSELRKNVVSRVISMSRTTMMSFENKLGFQNLSRQERCDCIEKAFHDLNPNDFIFRVRERYQQQPSITGDAQEQIFNAMYKYDTASRHLDCHSCGYTSCAEMVRAIAYGLNRKENCIHYANDALVKLYTIDQMTGLYNYEEFLRRTRSMIDQNSNVKYVMCWMDVKKLRVINHLLGYREGDRVLRLVGSALRRQIPSNGTSGRFADDSFVFCIPDEPGLYPKVSKIARDELALFDCTIPVNVAFGFCQIDNRETDLQEYVDNARLGYDSIKNSYNVNYGVYTEEMRRTIINEAEIMNMMDDALRLRQFHMYLQPQFNHATGELIGAEALIRWVHPTKGIIPPNAFISVFEKSGFILKSDRFIWEEACRQIQKWIREGNEPVPISVNISRVDIYDPDLVRYIEALVHKYEIPVNLLRLEITETAYMENSSQLLAVIKELQDKGFIIEMDDFGSGYSSLNTLKDVPVNILKLDLRFLSEGNDERGGNILQSVVRMAKWLELPIISEGVENKEQADFLKSIGCNVVQGFYYSRPIPVADFEKLKQKHVIAQPPRAAKTFARFNLKEFWDPNGYFTHLFNVAVSGIAMFEYYDNRLEIMRINAPFLKTIGLAEGLTEFHRGHCIDFAYAPDKERILAAVEDSIFNGTVNQIDSAWHFNHDDHDDLTYLRIKLRCIASNGDRYIIYANFDNITDLVKKK